MAFHSAPPVIGGRISFELHCQRLASGTFFNLVAQPHELGLTLVRPGRRRACQSVRGGGRDGAKYFLLAIHHRKQYDHPVKIVADKASAQTASS